MKLRLTKVQPTDIVPELTKIEQVVNTNDEQSKALDARIAALEATVVALEARLVAHVPPL